MNRSERKRAEADERQAARDTRGDAGQLSRLEAAGHGHCKEADRLRERIEKRHRAIKAAGFRIGTVQEFLDLTDEEMAAIETLVAQGRKKRKKS